MSTGTRVYIARLAGLPVFDPTGDQVGRVRDVVVALRLGRDAPRVLGLVIEIQAHKRIFTPIGRVTTIDVGAVVLATGTVSLRRFDKRGGETLVVAELLDRKVSIVATGEDAAVLDLAMEQGRTGDWLVNRVAVRKQAAGKTGALRSRRRGEVVQLEWDEIDGFALPEDGQGAANMLAVFEKLRPADLAGVMHDLTGKRRAEIAAALDDERLADVLEEMSEDEQVELLGGLEDDRAADVLEAMSPDDAADLLGELPAEEAARLLELMEPGRGRPRTRSAGLLRRHRRRHDDARAGRASAERHRGRGAGRDPQRRPVAGARGAGLRRPPALRDADRALLGHRALPADAARAAVGPGQQRGRHRRRPAGPGTARSPTSRATWPPTTWSPSRSSTASSGCSARSPSTTSWTTCCRRAGATPVRALRACRMAERKRSSSGARVRLDTPLTPRRGCAPSALRPRCLRAGV